MITHKFNINLEVSTKEDKPQDEVRNVIARALEHSTAAEAMIDALCPMGVQFDGWEIESVKSERVDPGLVAEIGLRHTSEDLDEHVHELKSKEASDINNAGMVEQVLYLLEQGGEEWLRETFLPEEE